MGRATGERLWWISVGAAALGVLGGCAPVCPPVQRGAATPSEAAPVATTSVAEAPARRMPIEVGLMVMGRETGAPWIEVSVNLSLIHI